MFCGPDGQPMSPDTVWKRFPKLVKAAGLGHVRFHDLRHTSVTLALRAGTHPRIVSERLGHASVSLTLDTYSHVTPDLQEEAAEALDVLLKAPKRSG